MFYFCRFSLKEITNFFSKLANHSLSGNIMYGMNFTRYCACTPLKSLQSSGREIQINNGDTMQYEINSPGADREVRVLGKAP